MTCRSLNVRVGGVTTGTRPGSYRDIVVRARIGELPRLIGGMNNRLFTGTVSGQDVVVKLYQTLEGAERETNALAVLESVGIAPRLLHMECDPVPAVVMTELPGTPLTDVNLGSEHLDALAACLSLLYDQPLSPGSPEVRTPPRRMIERVREAVEAGDQPEEVRRLWRHWERNTAAASLTGTHSVTFGRGDPNLANCLWDGQRIRLVDWEYAGMTDRAYELADLVEHPASRATPDRTWLRLVDRFSLRADEQVRFEAARGLIAIFWLIRCPVGDAFWRGLLQRAVALVEEGQFL